ncbi:MAG: hypothetical protein Q4D40_01530 [Eubacteriales bacterium]|nr:hypothetical protein [Eubacteriales bacterium]
MLLRLAALLRMLLSSMQLLHLAALLKMLLSIARLLYLPALLKSLLRRLTPKIILRVTASVS